ncbi:hypothetical protein [Tsukamurella soli]
MRFRGAGTAVLVECDSPAHAVAVGAAARGVPGVVDVVPAGATVLIEPDGAG